MLSQTERGAGPAAQQQQLRTGLTVSVGRGLFIAVFHSSDCDSIVTSADTRQAEEPHPMIFCAFLQQIPVWFRGCRIGLLRFQLRFGLLLDLGFESIVSESPGSGCRNV